MVWIWIVALGLAAGSKKTPSPAAAGPHPAAELQQLRYFEGEWKCDGKPADHLPSMRMQIKPDVDKNWYAVRRSEQRSAAHPVTHETAEYWGFDQAARQFMRMGVGNQGDWQNGSSPGWAGDDWVWTGEVNAPDGSKTLYRHTLSQIATREMSERFEINIDGEWRVRGASVTCKK